MLLFHSKVFDDLIAGSGTVYYSESQWNEQLGSADALGYQMCTSSVSGTATLSIQVEHSADGQNWVPEPGDVTQAVSNDSSFYGLLDAFNLVLLGLVRVKITLTGTNPQCWLKLYVTGRVRAPQQPPQRARSVNSGSMVT